VSEGSPNFAPAENRHPVEAASLASANPFAYALGNQTAQFDECTKRAHAEGRFPDHFEVAHSLL
jgi:hypothetical protein